MCKYDPNEAVDDSTGQLKTAVGKESGGVTNRLNEQFGYAYDAAGNLAYRTNGALSEPFTVDNLNQLTSITRTGAITVVGSTWEPATNLTVNNLMAIRYADNTFARTNISLSDGTNTFTAIAVDGYGRTDTNCVTVDLPTSVRYAYDANGNMVTNGTRFFEYDDENQVMRITEPNSWKTEFTYDGKMRRRITKDYAWNSGGWATQSELHYVYDGNLVVQQRDGSNVARIAYTRGSDLSGALEGAGGSGGLLARSELCQLPVKHVYHHSDGNGNVTAIVNGLQSVCARYVYDPFGALYLSADSLPTSNPYRFALQETHGASGLSYYGHRFYDPSLQRWPNSDPLGELGFEAARGKGASRSEGDHNRYRFVRNDALSNWDYLGLDEPGCDTGAPVIRHDWYLGCCSLHDKCYYQNGCTAKSSWPLLLDPFSVCGGCNRSVCLCWTQAFFGIGTPLNAAWFCPRGQMAGTTYYNYQNIPADCWSDGVKPPNP